MLLVTACGGGPTEIYHLDLRFGGPGADPGQFHEPTGIALSDSEVFVADARNARIQVFNHRGTFLRQFGHEVLKRPMNLERAGDELFVPDYFEDAIFVFSLDGVLRTVIRPSPEQGLSSPGGVAIRRDGTLLVADTYAHRIVQLTRDGEVLRVWGEAGKKGIAAARFNYPTDVAVTPDDGFVVADGYNDRLQLFSPDGQFERKWGGLFGLNTSGGRPGWFRTVSAVAVAPDGAIYASDFFNGRVQRFSPDGDVDAVMDVTGHAGPLGVSVSRSGDVFVAHVARNEVQVWRRQTTR
jgi:DNA-binding beta-propeller fold protein YncE